MNGKIPWRDNVFVGRFWRTMMQSWVEEQSKTGRYANSSDYVRDLIRRDRARREAIMEIRAAVDVGLAGRPAAPLDRDTFKSRMRA